MKKLIHNILAVMLVVVMVIMSFGNQSVLPISIVNANESEIVYPFGYKSSDLFVADAILGQANGLDFTNISSMPILHNYTYKTLAEGIIDNKWLLGGSVVWKNAEACLNHDFIGLVTWRQIMYETLIMDWLTYQFESDEFKSEISKSSASYGWAISNYLIKDDVKIPSKGDANTIKVFDKEFYKSIGMLEKADQINEIISGINDVYTNSKDFYKQVSNILATQSACESRISFLREVQDVTNNQSLSNAIDTVIDKLYMSAGRLSFTEGSFVMAKQLANVTWDLLIAPYETSIPLLRELKLGKAGIDWMFNTSNENSKKIELTFIYMMNADFTKAYQILRENYKDDKSEKNALVYNNAYLDYTVYQAYSSMITEEYIAEKMLNGALNEIVNIFSDYNIQSYNDLKKMLDDDIKVSQGYYNLVGKYYSTYETVFKKNEYMSWYYDNVVHPTGVYFKRKEVEIGLQDDTFYFYDDVTVTPDNVTDGSVKYTSSDESVVTVKDKQVLSIEVHKVGSAIITVTTNDGNYQDTLKINVVEGHGKDGFYLENGSKEPNIGDIFTIGELEYEIIKKGEVCVKYGTNDVTDVDIPKYVSYKGYSYKVTSIEEHAFFKSYSLASITIPNSVTSIGRSAFFKCYRLASVIIPNSVTSIEDAAFEGCESLTSITIPGSVTSIESDVFESCESLTSITIPNSVTSIGDSAFNRCTSLTNITIPDSVTSIGQGAFAHCKSLTSITIPNGVTSIGQGAFANCKSLTNITIPDSVTSIGAGVFEECESLTSITIPNSVTSIEASAFEGCTSLTNITIPDSVTSIWHSAFTRCTSLTNITIPNSVTSIWDFAFKGCTSLTNITIPGSVTSIGDSAFTGCTSLTSITIPNGVTSIGGEAFSDCTSLTNITIPGSVISIGGSAFSDCKSLEELIIPEGVRELGASIIADTCIEKIKIPSTVTIADRDTFGTLYGDDVLTEVEFAEGMTRIPQYMCSDANTVKKIVIPSTVTSIGDNAFDRCTSLTNITIPDSVTSIESNVFKFCESLTSIIIPNGVTSIEQGAFYYCTGLTNITIPGSVTSIGDSAFTGCTSLTSITIPNGVTSIGYSAFEGCTSLTNITIPDSVTSIEGYAFDSCKNLKDITIPGNVTSIKKYAFFGCDSLVANVYNNSTGLTYCKDYNIDYKIVGTYDEFSDIQIENGTCTNIDESTELKVNQLKEGNDYDVVSKSFDNFELYDLSFYKDDQKVTIDGTAIVRIPVKEGMDGSKCKVYYNDNGTFTDMGAVYKDGYMEFETNHFSQYVVAEIESSTFTLGDVNEDGKVDFLDAIVVLRHDAEIIQLTDNQMKAAEVNKDGKVDFLDAIMILRYDAEIINGFN